MALRSQTLRRSTGVRDNSWPAKIDERSYCQTHPQLVWHWDALASPHSILSDIFLFRLQDALSLSASFQRRPVVGAAPSNSPGSLHWPVDFDTSPAHLDHPQVYRFAIAMVSGINEQSQKESGRSINSFCSIS